ncbi:MAG: single-stranded-DNA-specific exonuclease RecJ [Paludibacteraceae bacterium]|nr:single-stranded-DNA-specific exonuclease RecJ [Paludibacteraceae bacterium]
MEGCGQRTCEDGVRLNSVKYSWQIQTLSDEQQAVRDRLAEQLHIAPIAAGLLVRRGITTPEAASAFVHPSLDQLHDPMLMLGMREAEARLTKAVEQGEKILIYGDYDVDGTTAVALMYRFLSTFYTNIDYYIPDRYTEGYGISFRGVDYAQEQGCTLIIALDCGIKSADKVAYALQRGIDFIICDHHLPGGETPQAVAVLDSKQADDPYPFKDLSGCGVGFKLAQAYAQTHKLSFETYLTPLLELLAMSIASDIVPLVGENRVLAYFGIRQINMHPSVGLQGLLKMTGWEGQPVNISDLVYRIGPRLNACGRIKSGRAAVELLISNDATVATEIAQTIEAFNSERKEKDETITQEALHQLEADPEHPNKHTNVAYGATWHRGVLGIVASRLTETYYRPTIVLADTDDGLIAGSARSVGGFDIYSAIDSCRDLLTNFGGHVFAAGLSMLPQNLPEFKRRFEEYVAAHITDEQQVPVLRVEEELQLQNINKQFYNVLRHMEPFGPDNPHPKFVTRGLINNRYTKRVGKTGEHLRLDLTDRSVAITGIAFGMGDMAMYIQNGNAVDVCYSLEQNTYNGITSLQMKVEDIVPAEKP